MAIQPKGFRGERVSPMSAAEMQNVVLTLLTTDGGTVRTDEVVIASWQLKPQYPLRAHLDNELKQRSSVWRRFHRQSEQGLRNWAILWIASDGEPARRGRATTVYQRVRTDDPRYVRQVAGTDKRPISDPE